MDTMDRIVLIEELKNNFLSEIEKMKNADTTKALTLNGANESMNVDIANIQTVVDLTRDYMDIAQNVLCLTFGNLLKTGEYEKDNDYLYNCIFDTLSKFVSEFKEMFFVKAEEKNNNKKKKGISTSKTNDSFIESRTIEDVNQPTGIDQDRKHLHFYSENYVNVIEVCNKYVELNELISEGKRILESYSFYSNEKVVLKLKDVLNESTKAFGNKLGKKIAVVKDYKKYADPTDSVLKLKTAINEVKDRIEQIHRESLEKIVSRLARVEPRADIFSELKLFGVNTFSDDNGRENEIVKDETVKGEIVNEETKSVEDSCEVSDTAENETQQTESDLKTADNPENETVESAEEGEHQENVEDKEVKNQEREIKTEITLHINEQTLSFIEKDVLSVQNGTSLPLYVFISILDNINEKKALNLKLKEVLIENSVITKDAGEVVIFDNGYPVNLSVESKSKIESILLKCDKGEFLFTLDALNKLENTFNKK